MYKVIFLDYSMPVKDGPLVAIEIREICQKHQVQVPYIVCATSYTEASFKREALDAGMNDVLSKPIQLS